VPSLPAVRALFSLLLLLCAAPPVLATVLIDACPGPPLQWLCYGYLEIRAPQSITRIFSYDNRETLVETERAGRLRRLIRTGQGNFADQLEDDGTVSSYPLDSWSEVLGPVFAVLPLAYPDGPQSVPVEPRTQTISIDHNNTAILSASRGGDGEIRFHIRIIGEDIAPVEGSYRAGLLPALPGDFNLRGWYRIAPSWLKTAPARPEPAPERLEQLR
jgi:hypothetical protein